MLLSARILANVVNVNTFDHATEACFTEGDGPAIYLQLIDASKDRADKGFHPPGRRYAPASGATLSVVVENIDDDLKLTRTATQPFTNDPSIWMVQFLSTDPTRGTAHLRLVLTEGAVVRRGTVHSALSVQSQGAL